MWSWIKFFFIYDSAKLGQGESLGSLDTHRYFIQPC